MGRAGELRGYWRLWRGKGEGEGGGEVSQQGGGAYARACEGGRLERAREV